MLSAATVMTTSNPAVVDQKTLMLMPSHNPPRLSDNLYLLFRELLRSRSGLDYPEQKRDDLEHGLTLAMHACGLPDLDKLYTKALSNEKVWETILNQLTIGETSFFRNRPQFEALQKAVIPELLERRANTRNLRIWSAGCATGEEPYSLAILLRETIPNIAEWHISILATDINTVFLERARQGIYSSWSFRDNPEDFRMRYFTQEKNRWIINPEIRSMVAFNRLNLVEPVYPSLATGTSALDMIVCRNVTIYFDERTTCQVVQRFYHALAPGGWLIVGHSEPQTHVYRQFEVFNFPNAIFYRKPLDTPLFSSPDEILRLITTDCLSSSQRSRGPVAGPSGAFPSAAKEHLLPATRPHPMRPGSELVSGHRDSSLSPPIPSSSELWSAITASLKQGNSTRAEELLNTLLEVHPDHVEALTTLGTLYADRGEWACAQSYCERAIHSNPLHIKAHYILAQIHEHQRQYEAALSEYRRVVFLDPQHVMGMLGMANVWRQLGRLDNARRRYRNVLKLLTTYAPHTIVPESGGATAGELAAFAARQTQLLKEV